MGRDGRPSGKWIEQCAAGALAAAGREVRITGMAPTPTVQLMAEHSDAAGGIAITASHNPKEWNGLKFLNSSGIFLDALENKKLWEAVDSGFFFYKKENFQNIIFIEDAVNRHINSILSLPLFKNFLQKIKERKFRVVVDAVNASGSFAIPELLERLGCDVIRLHCAANGLFPHTPEPVPENLSELAQKTKDEKADIGIAVDPDADRLVLIDEKGEPIGEEKTIAVSVKAVLKNKEYFNDYADKAVVNYSTTRLTEEIAARFDAKISRSPVGEINVVKKMKEVNAAVGGEGSGGVILPASHYGRDSLVGTALTLCLLAQENISLSELNASFPKFEMIKLKRGFSGDIDTILDRLEKEFSDGKAVRDDGIKIDFEKSWVQLRASNTEPIVRIIAEAPEKSQAEKLASRAINCLK